MNKNSTNIITNFVLLIKIFIMDLQIHEALKDKRLLKAIIDMNKKEIWTVIEKLAHLVMCRNRSRSRAKTHIEHCGKEIILYSDVYENVSEFWRIRIFMGSKSVTSETVVRDELRRKLEKVLSKEMVLAKHEVRSMLEFLQRFPQVKNHYWRDETSDWTSKRQE